MDDRTGRVPLVDAAGGAWTTLSTTASIVATALAALFVVGLEAGATAAGSENPLLQAPLHQATRVDELLLSTPPVSLDDRALAMVWPLVEAPLLAGMEVGLAAPLVGHVVFYGALLGLVATAATTVAGVAFRPIGRWLVVVMLLLGIHDEVAYPSSVEAIIAFVVAGLVLLLYDAARAEYRRSQEGDDA